MWQENVKIVNIEGIDGTGKSSIIRKMCTKLYENGENVLTLKTPNYNLLTGKLINALITGKIVEDPFTIDPITTSLCYTIDRLINYKVQEIEKEVNNFINKNIDTLIISDRSYMSNFFYQASRYTTENGKVTMESIEKNINKVLNYLAIMQKLEIDNCYLSKYSNNIVNIVLYHPNINTNIKLMELRNTNKDKYETDINFLTNISNFQKFFKIYDDKYKYLEMYYPAYCYEFIQCSNNEGNLFSIDNITNDVLDHIKCHNIQK